MMDDEKRHLESLERKVKRSRGFSSDAEDISEELDVRIVLLFCYDVFICDKRFIHCVIVFLSSFVYPGHDIL